MPLIEEFQEASSPRKHAHIRDVLRREIVSSVLAPGAQLPTRDDLMVRFHASRATVQRGLTRLIRDGFVQARGRGGTYVVDHPPHLYHYGLLLPGRPNSPNWSRFWTALDHEAAALSVRGPRRVRAFYGIDEHTDTHAYKRLARAVRGQRLAGLVLVMPPQMLAHTAALRRRGPNCPAVAIAQPHQGGDVPVVALDGESFVSQALEHLAARGRRRIAILAVPGQPPETLELWRAGIASRGMTTRPAWVQAVAPAHAAWASHVVQLLAAGREAPDGLIVTNDNLVESAAAGLMAAGVTVPDAMDVVAHCNFPRPAHSVLPVRHLGYDAREVLEVCLDLIERQRGGERVPSASFIEARFATVAERVLQPEFPP